MGEDGKRNILTGIKQWYKAEELVGKRCLFIINLEPRRMMGEESEGMFLAAEGSDRPIPLVPAEDVPPRHLVTLAYSVFASSNDSVGGIP